MSDAAAGVDGLPNARGTWTARVAWFLSGVVAAPACTLVHEMGHYIVGGIFDFPNLKFLGDAVTSSAGADRFPAWQLGLMAFAGPTATLILGAVLVIVAILRPGCLSISLALTALIRPIAMAVRYAILLVVPTSTVDKRSTVPSPLVPDGSRIRADGLDNLCDETVAALHFGLPRWALVAGGFVIAAWLTWLLLSKTRPWWSVANVLTMFLGVVAGMLGFVYVLLPLILR